MLAFLPVLDARAEPDEWRTECIGRQQLDLPVDVEMATISPDTYRRDYDAPKHRFSDGAMAQFTDLRFGGPMAITRELSAGEKKKVDAEHQEWFKQSKEAAQRKYSGKAGDANSLKSNFERLNMERPGLAWRVGGRWLMHTYLGQHALSWGISVEPSEQETARKYFANLARNLSPRALFSNPRETGVCLPFAFVADDGETERAIAVAYRLLRQPDVTVLLSDASAAGIASFQDPEKFDPVYRSESFWSQVTRGLKSRENLLLKRYNKISFSGQMGIETMHKLNREDGGEDFGYLVVTRGDPQAKTDTPDLTLYVRQDTATARKHGVEPLSKEAFFKLAKRIAASVTHR